MYKNLSKILFLSITIFILSSCYQMISPDSGTLSLNATLPAKANSGDEIWVVCVVLDAAFENQLRDMLRLYDKEDFYGDDLNPEYNQSLSDSYEEEADEMLEDMLTKGAVRFDGGRFFYQFKMDYSGGNTGEFVVPGIPADKEYFLYVMIFHERIDSFDDFDQDTDVYMEMKYYDPDYYTGGHPGIASDVGKGWYYFNEWDYSESGGNPTLSGSTTVWEKNGSRISNQPFLIEPGDDNLLEVLLVEDPE